MNKQDTIRPKPKAMRKLIFDDEEPRLTLADEQTTDLWLKGRLAAMKQETGVHEHNTDLWLEKRLSGMKL